MKPKFFLIVLPFMLNAVMCYAQKTHIIEPAELEITYSIKEPGFWNTCIFRYGKNVSQYFSCHSLKEDKMLADDDPARSAMWDKRLADFDEPDPAKRLPGGTGYNNIIYCYHKDGIFKTYARVFGTHYLITENITIPEWTLCEDTTSILGMECKKATTNFRGRYWEVWYTEDIPISQGPWKLCGLPGMILKANSPKFMLIEAMGIKNKNLEPVTFYNYLNYKYAPIERMEYLKKVHKPGVYPGGGSCDTIEIDDKK